MIFKIFLSVLFFYSIPLLLMSQTCWQNYYNPSPMSGNSVSALQIHESANGFFLTVTFVSGSIEIYSINQNGELNYATPQLKADENSFTPVSDGGFVLAYTLKNGDTFQLPSSNIIELKEIVIKKFNAEATEDNDSWEFRFFDGDNSLMNIFVKELDNQDILASYRTCGFDLNTYCIPIYSALVRMTSSGDSVFVQNFYDKDLLDVAELPNGDIVGLYAYGGNLHLIGLNSMGQTLWTQSGFGSFQLNHFYSTKIHKSTTQNLILNTQTGIYKTDLSGNLIWHETIDANAIYPVENGGFLTVNEAPNPDYTNHQNINKIHVKKYDQNAQQLNEWFLPDTTNNSIDAPIDARFNANDIKVTSNGEIVVLGTKANISNGIYVAVFDSTSSCYEPINTYTDKNECGTLTAGNVAAGFCNSGLFFNTFLGGGFYTPIDSQTKTIFSSGLWLGGKDVLTDQLYLSATTYGQMQSSYWPGLIEENMGGIKSMHWDRVWKVSHSEIINHINDFLDNGQIDNPNPSIFEWPGEGNPHAKGKNGESISVSKSAAPFVDLNQNGIYEPHLGEYPLIKGCEMLWFVMNDSLHGNMQGLNSPFNAEIQVSAYAFSDTSFPDLYNSIIAEYKIYNYSGRDYYDFYFGKFIDFEIGCFNNNYVGVDTLNNTFYGYSATEIDATCATQGFGQDPPIQTATSLNHDFSSFVSYESNFNPISGIPTKNNHYYNYMQGNWLDGSPITYGDNGIGGNTAFPFLYNGNPADTTTWSECSVNNPPGSRRSVGSIGMSDFENGQSKTVKYMYTTFYGENLSACFDYNATAEPRLIYLKDNYTNHLNCNNEGSLPEIPDSLIQYPSSIYESSSEKIAISVFPNPATEHAIITLDGFEFPSIIELWDVKGRKVQSEKTYKNTYLLNTVDLQTGTYFIKVINKNKGFKSTPLHIVR
ncbi:MAG: T9SS C-terminal target domain-containing protein [Chitinophagaceae bacterium]|nr:MAG: T9SS C-terminal target domain-containing protein [Chitinophagaceae bacterium]